MQPGINLGVPEDDYFKFPGCSQSRLRDLAESPAYCRFNIDHPPRPTDAMLLGSAIDCRITRPTDFPLEYLKLGQCSLHTKAGPRCTNGASKIVGGQPVCGVHGRGMPSETTLQVLSSEDYDVVEAAHAAVMSHSTARELLEACDDFQLSLLWDFNSMPCKARLDGASWELDGGTIIDLKKSARKGSWHSAEDFSRTLYNYGYHMQGAFYRWGARQCGHEVNNVVFIVVDETRIRERLQTAADDLRLNECVNVYRLRDESLYYGELQVQPLLAQYHECWKSGQWPFSEDIIDIGIPDFAARIIERNIV